MLGDRKEVVARGAEPEGFDIGKMGHGAVWCTRICCVGLGVSGGGFNNDELLSGADSGESNLLVKERRADRSAGRETAELDGRFAGGENYEVLAIGTEGNVSDFAAEGDGWTNEFPGNSSQVGLISREKGNDQDERAIGFFDREARKVVVPVGARFREQLGRDGIQEIAVSDTVDET